jgi:putative ABC transport system permease protein
VLVGFAAAKRYLGSDGHANIVYVRAQDEQVAAVQSVLAQTADPEAPTKSTSASPPPR